MADLQPHVPQAIEHRLGDGLAPGGLLVGQQEQQIDVGARRHQAAAVAAGRDHRHALGFRRILRRIELRADELEQDADDLVLHWHSRSAQRRPWRSLSSSCSARARACVSAAFSRCATAVRNSRSRPAWVSASASRSATIAALSISSTLGARRSLRVQHHRIGIAEARFAVIVRSRSRRKAATARWFNRRRNEILNSHDYHSIYFQLTASRRYPRERIQRRFERAACGRVTSAAKARGQPRRLA